MKKKPDFIKLEPETTNDENKIIYRKDHGIYIDKTIIKLDPEKPQTKEQQIQNLNAWKDYCSNDTFEHNFELIKNECLEIVKSEIGKSIIKREEYKPIHPDDCPAKVYCLDGYIIKSEPPVIVRDATKTLSKIFGLEKDLENNRIKEALNLALKIGSDFESIRVRRLEKYALAGKRFYLKKSKNAEECRKALIEYLKEHPKQGITKAREEVAIELGVSLSSMYRHTKKMKHKKK